MPTSSATNPFLAVFPIPALHLFVFDMKTSRVNEENGEDEVVVSARVQLVLCYGIPHPTEIEDLSSPIRIHFPLFQLSGL